MDPTDTRQARLLLALALILLVLTALSCSCLALVHEEPLKQGGITIQQTDKAQ